MLIQTKTIATMVAAAALSLGSAAVWAQATAKTETLPSGVVVEHLSAGAGARPQASSTVQVHYRGTLSNGQEFDSSYRRNAPASFPLNGVIPCWTQGLQRMQVGGKAKLTCPAATAYGERGAGGAVPPNAVLTFEVELLAIQK
jgi:FKBP-type peptidyl-prolyl cis-trans isomerase FkpA